MAAVDVVVASVVPSVVRSPLSAAVILKCAYVRMAAACVPGLSCVSVSGEEWVSSSPVGALVAPVEKPPAQVSVCAGVAAASARLVETVATARGCEPD